MDVRPQNPLFDSAAEKHSRVSAGTESRPASRPAEASFTGRRPKVLVGEDARALLLLMTNALQAADFEVATARTGRHAVERAREFEPDIVLLDIGMPELDGIAACEIIRRESGKPNLPVVMVTGSDDEKAIHRAFAAGAAGFITKPFDWLKFPQRIREFLSGHRERDESREPAMQQDTQRRQ